MYLATELNQTTKEAVEAKGYDYSEFVSFVANVWNEGAFQALPEEDLEAGLHYRDAEQVIEGSDGSDFLADWRKHKELYKDPDWS